MKPYYDAEGITIYHGDCRDIELPVACADVLLTDPPYGMAYESSADLYGKNGGRGGAIAADGVRQGVRSVRQMLIAIQPVLKADAHLYLFCHWQSWPDFYDAVSTYERVRNALIWWKRTAGMGNFGMEYSKDYETILYAVRGRREFVDGSRHGSVIDGHPPVPNAKRQHPTEKPVSLLHYLLARSAQKGDLVLDPFMGSGTTLEAARLRGCRAIGIEIEERYCEIAARRLGQGVLDFGEAG